MTLALKRHEDIDNSIVLKLPHSKSNFREIHSYKNNRKITRYWFP